MTARPDGLPDPAEPVEEASAPEAVLGLVERSRELRSILELRRTLPDDVGGVRAAIAEQTGEESRVSARDIEALVALGVMARVISGGESRLLWVGGALAPELARDEDEAHARSDENRIEVESDLFRLDLAIDLESEKLLLFRTLMMLELIAAIVLLRQVALMVF